MRAFLLNKMTTTHSSPSRKVSAAKTKYNWKAAETQITGEKLDFMPQGPFLREALDDFWNKASFSIQEKKKKAEEKINMNSQLLTPQPHPVERAIEVQRA